jgi:DNA repair exonuclease SbcCD ATPase subunit
MSITPNVPPAGESELFERASTPRWVPLVIVVLFLGLVGAVYAGYTARTRLEGDMAAANTKADNRAELLNKELEQTNERLAQLRGQLEVTSQKLGLTQDELARARTLAQQIQKQQQESDSQLATQIGQVKQESEAQIGQVSTDLTGAKTDIASTRKDLEDTKARLTSTVGDLGVQSGLIAHNHDDLEALKRLNERNIFEFNLTKSKTPQRVGPIQIALRKADPKRFKYTMTVVADDKAIEKKDRTAEEPVQFYVRGSRAPYEIVVFDVTKNRVTGYLSTPKVTAQAAAAPATGAAPKRVQ